MVTFEFPPFHWLGGEGAYAAGLCDTLLKLGHEVTVLTTNINMRVSHNAERPHVVFIDTINRPPFRFLSFFGRARGELKKIGQNRNFDIVHYINSYSSSVISRQEVNIPVVATMHQPYVDERKACLPNSLGKLTVGYSWYFLSLLMEDLFARNLCKKATKTIAVSKFIAESIINWYGILPGDVVIIPNAVDTARFNPNVSGNDLREKWKLYSDPLVVYVGRLAPQKGLNYLIEAFANTLRDIPDTKLIIVGEGFLKSELMTMCRKLNLENSIKFLGRVSDEDLPHIYAAADLVILPSIMEGFGIVLLEAMATSKPCVGTTGGGIPEVVVDGETGILVPAGDSSALYKAICLILEDRSLSRKFGEAGRKRVEEKFTWNVVAKETIALYEQLLDKS